ncbi:hypothetical protein [Novosphingobium sp.]|uniref:hypothetical protein n=1 Tax=Novosphingobium sp. TaxID=1874826 RepID=UPI003D132945
MPSLSKLVGMGAPPAGAQFMVGDVAAGLTATGTTQGTALALSANFNQVTTVAASAGVVLPAISAAPSLGVSNGDSIEVFNQGANALAVYPPVGSTINSLAANTALSVAAAKSARFIQLSPTNWGAVLSA